METWKVETRYNPTIQHTAATIAAPVKFKEVTNASANRMPMTPPAGSAPAMGCHPDANPNAAQDAATGTALGFHEGLPYTSGAFAASAPPVSRASSMSISVSVPKPPVRLAVWRMSVPSPVSTSVSLATPPSSTSSSSS